MRITLILGSIIIEPFYNNTSQAQDARCFKNFGKNRFSQIAHHGRLSLADTNQLCFFLYTMAIELNSTKRFRIMLTAKPWMIDFTPPRKNQYEFTPQWGLRQITTAATQHSRSQGWPLILWDTTPPCWDPVPTISASGSLGWFLVLVGFEAIRMVLVWYGVVSEGHTYLPTLDLPFLDLPIYNPTYQDLSITPSMSTSQHHS